MKRFGTTLPLAMVMIVGAQVPDASAKSVNVPTNATAQPRFVTPPVYQSAGGVLAVTMEAKPTQVLLGTQVIEGATYNGSYGGPVLRLRPGDTLRMHLVNHLPQMTNVHFHGLAVSPQGHGDDSMHMIKAGESWDYIIPIPKDHPPGVYWFHTHGHQAAERQLMGGLSGTLIIEGFQDEVPATRPLVERLMALKEFSPNGQGRLNNVPKPGHGSIRSINGQVDPVIAMRPGETQLWRLSGQTANAYFRLRLDGAKLTIVGRDARPLLHPQAASEVLLGPSERVDVLVTAGREGRYTFDTASLTTGPMGDIYPAQTMATVVVAPDAALGLAAPLGSIVVNAPKQVAIPGNRIDAQRLVVFSEDPVTGLFFMNHQTFDHERVDARVPLGSIEEWTVRNTSEEIHVFHIHQLPFQVVSINGKAVPFNGLQDTIDVPIHGEVKLRMAFTDPTIVGRFMYHCHILEHEDKGMMSQIEVFDPKAPAPSPATMAGMHHGG